MVLIGLLTFSFNVRSEEVKVKFHAVVPGMLKPFTTLYIACTHNGWSPSSPVWAMKEVERNVFEFEFALPEGTPLEYKYTLGDWLTVETKADGFDIPNRRLVVASNVVRRDTVARWKMESVNMGRWREEDVMMYQIQYVKENYREKVEHIETLAELDSLIQSAETIWKQQANEKFGGVGSDFFAECYTDFTLMKNLDVASAGRDLVFQNYMLPAYMRDYPKVRESPNEQKSRHLFYGYLILSRAFGEYWLAESVSSPSLEVQIPDSVKNQRRLQWEKFKMILADLPKTVNTYLKEVTYSDASIKATLLSFKHELSSLEPYWLVQDDLNNGQPTSALKRLTRISATGDVRRQEFQILSLLTFQQLAKQSNKKEAFAVLDMLAKVSKLNSGFNEYLKQNLRKHYLRVDSVLGKQRYGKIQELYTADSFPFVRKVKSKEILAGIYKDIRSGKSIDLSTFRGKKVVIDFWTTWCGPCVAETPALIEFAANMKERNDVVFLSVNCDATTMARGSDNYVRGFVKALNINYPVLIDRNDDSLQKRFQIEWYPTKILINEQGEVSPRDLSLEKIERMVAVNSKQSR